MYLIIYCITYVMIKNIEIKNISNLKETIFNGNL